MGASCKVETKTHKAIPMKRPGSPVLTRRSLRAPRIEPVSEGLRDDDLEKPAPLASPQKSPSPETPSPHDLCKFQSGSSLDLASLSFNEENIARFVPGRIMSVKFMPSNDLRMVIVGDVSGNVAFWNNESNKGEDADDNPGIFLYKPHLGSVSGIAVQPPCLSKVLACLTSRMCGLENASENLIFILPGSSRINTIDFSSTNNNIMATSSSDGTACIWDIRCMDAAKPKALKVINNEKPVHSAYFSPSGCSLATTSLNSTVGIVSGSNFEDTSTILHDNKTGTWLSNFRSTWGWDDSYLFVGNMNRGVDVISPTQRRTILTLVSPNVTTIPCRFDAHPYQVGTLTGATSGGQVYVWTS